MGANDYILTETQEKDVVSAIKQAEMATSGEIRVHIEADNDKDALDRATEVFYQLNMQQTQAQNGVLFYVAYKSHQFAIIGDKGIDALVPDDFWDEVKNLVIDAFKKGDYAHGLIAGINKAGEKLKTFFPYQSDDTNELSDDISKN